MKEYKRQNIIKGAPIGSVRLEGYVGQLMGKFFEERVLSEYARSVVFGETEEAFVRCTDGDKPIGLWQGEFWGKWIISAVRVCRYLDDAELKEFLHKAALRMVARQRENGYIGTYKDSTNFMPPNIRGNDWNWNIWCRKYTLWGLLECYGLCGDEAILTACVRMADNLIDEISTVGVRLGETGAFKGVASCSILKPMLILYRITEDERYLSFCLDFVKDWEDPQLIPGLIANVQSLKPLGEWYDFTIKWAKAYEMMSCFDGLVELYRITDAPIYLDTAEKFYGLLIKYELNPLYSVAFNDEFRDAAESINAITEPCDVIHWMRLCYELFSLTGKPEYMDSIELAFYNPFLASSFKDGKWGARGARGHGRHLVAFGQAGMKYSHCCVNNMPRGYLNMAESCVMTSDDAIYVNLYSQWSAEVTVGDKKVAIRSSGRYLADSKAVLSVDFGECPPCDIFLRIPAWTDSATVVAEGREYHPGAGYFRICPTASVLEITLEFDSEVKIIPLSAHREKIDDPWKPLRWTSECPEGGCPEKLYMKEDRCLLRKGAVLLCRSKLIGNSEDEMFGGGVVAPWNECSCRESEAAEGINLQFHLELRGDGSYLETEVCDYASGTNFLSDDVHSFSIYF